jgi:hypothetical protein
LGEFVLAFAVPFPLADQVRLPRDLYYGIYAAALLLFFVLWARATGERLNVMARRRWRLAVILGAVLAVVLSLVVIRSEAASVGPGGLVLAGCGRRLGHVMSKDV